jgi:hypothetical protein
VTARDFLTGRSEDQKARILGRRFGAPFWGGARVALLDLEQKLTVQRKATSLRRQKIWALASVLLLFL